MITRGEQVKIKRIEELKKEKKAVIIAHNYQLDIVQEIADITGDSLELARKASKTKAETIVFCGVRFMAETSAIISPDKTILLPVIEADCPLARMITVPQLKALKKKHPHAGVVSYVNSSAEIKAESDICCTSSNAIKVVNALLHKEILFIPDKYLGDYTSQQANRKMILWEGYCPTHRRILAEDILKKKALYP
ncbi:MAG: quinolinate synthase NadA, partial [Candidatus Omnitrophica bacterium]|nr:quinolinate synthase NadA [Candidatus Omnitrophota bacterium]